MPDPEKPECGLCHHGMEANEICGQLYQSSECMAHLRCMQYSAGLIQYKYNLGFGGFKIEKVLGEISRGKKLKCALCKGSSKKPNSQCRGATAGCAVAKCSKTFHFYCAHKDSQTVTRRMEVMVQHKDPAKKRKMVEYRVFCSRKHQEAYEKDKKKDHQYIRKPAEESGSDEPGSDTDMPPAEMMSQSMKDFDFETDSSTDDSNDDSSSSSAKHSQSTKKKKKKKSSEDTSSDDFQPETKKMRPSSSRSRVGKLKKSPRRPSTTSTDSTTTGEDAHKSRHVSPKKHAGRRSAAAREEEENGSYGSDDVSQSSVTKAIGTLTPVQDKLRRASADNDTDTAKKNLSFSSNVKKKRHDKAVDVSQSKGLVIAKLDPEKDCLLCFVERAEVSPGLEQKLRKFATRMFQIPAGSLYVNKYPGFQLMGNHVVYLLKDLTMTLRQGDLAEFQRLVLDLKEEDISKYNYIIALNDDYPQDLSNTLYGKLRDSIRENLQTASTNMGTKIGWYCRVQYQEEHIRIALIALTQPTDPTGLIRDSFRNRIEVYQWEQSENPTYNSEAVTPESCKKEFDILKQWLSTMEGALIDPRPRDNLILGSTKDSNTVRLFNHFKAATVFQQTTACIIFLRPLDSNVVNVLEYIRKLFCNILSESRDARSTVVLVLDLRDDLDLQQHVLCHLPPEVKVRVLTAFKPDVDGVSCAVITMDLEASSLCQYVPEPDSIIEDLGNNNRQGQKSDLRRLQRSLRNSPKVNQLSCDTVENRDSPIHKPVTDSYSDTMVNKPEGDMVTEETENERPVAMVMEDKGSVCAEG